MCHGWYSVGAVVSGALVGDRWLGSIRAYTHIVVGDVELLDHVGRWVAAGSEPWSSRVYADVSAQMQREYVRRISKGACVGWWDGGMSCKDYGRKRKGEYEKGTRRREEDQQSQENLRQTKRKKKFQGFHPSPRSLMGGKFAWRQFQSSPVMPQSCPPKPGCWVSKPRRRVGRYQPATPRVLLGLHARNAMRLSLGGKNPAAEQSVMPACLPALPA